MIIMDVSSQDQLAEAGGWGMGPQEPSPGGKGREGKITAEETDAGK